MASIEQTVIEELRVKREIVFQPTEDIDLIWVVSGPGTYDSTPTSGLYRGLFKDRERIKAGIEIVRQVTALRLGITVDEVTKEMIDQCGPVFYFNGEEQGQGAFPQNPDLREAASLPEFPLPASKIVISTLAEIFTPGQIKNLVAYLTQHPETKKIAVVTHGPHQRRVARYVEQHKHFFPPGVVFIDAGIPEIDVPVGAVLAELRRIIAYLEKGDLAAKPNY